ncbi:MAG: ABC transporter substrate-binding protein [Nitrososphaerota archaeon]|nr:ABC transporter substrate-binding protein [Candidatus Calditenuaceae archaeon]MDW8073552.1 ABC transporter substrate-binding protein [Nitrososphaerota archaeon]
MSLAKKAAPILATLLIAGFVLGIATAAFTPLIPPKTTTLTATQTKTVERLERLPVTTTLTETITRQPSLPLKLEVKYSRQFEVTFLEGYKVVRDAINRTLILVPRGAQPPRGMSGEVVYTPVERAVLMSATQVALVERLREYAPWIIDRVSGIMWGQQYEWYFEEIRLRISTGRIKDVGPDYSPSFEELVALKPDLVIIYTFPGSDLPQRLEELGIPFVVDNEYLETSPLGRFEWIKLIATFFDLDEEAYKIFSDVEAEVGRVAGEVRRSGADAPLVCWFMVYRGTVYAAGGESFPANTLAMLGARYGFSDVKSTGSVVVNVEEVLSRCRDADVVVYPTSFISNVGDILSEAPELAEIRAFREGRVYAYASTVFQLGYYDTEGWFRDLAVILYPGLYPGEEVRYFVRLGG